MVTRRQFLGTSLAFGLSSTLLGSLARSAVAANATPCRFVFVIEGNGIEPVCFLSDAARDELDAINEDSVGAQRWWYRDYQHDAPVILQNSGLASAKALGPLLGDGGAVTSLESKAAVIYGLSSRIAGGGHSTAAGALACARSTSQRPGGPTIDAFLANLPQIRQNTPFEAIRLGVHPNNRPARLNYTTCAYDVGRPAPVIVDPSTGYDNLFSSVGTPEEVAKFDRRSDLIDFGLSSTHKRLSCFKGAADQRLKLETYKAALEELLERQATLKAMSGALAAVKPASPAENALFTSTEPLARLEAQFQLATAGLMVGLSNVCVLGSGIGGYFDLSYPSYNGILNGRSRHDLHHESAGNPAFVDTIHNISRDHVSLAASLARALEAQPENGGTMLDHTLIVTMGDNGEQHHSTASEWPLLLIGGKALGFKTDGRTVIYPGTDGGPQHRQVSSFFTTLAHAAGEPISSFGNEGPTLMAEGPLAEIRSA
jgi:hypothetical protein